MGFLPLGLSMQGCRHGGSSDLAQLPQVGLADTYQKNDSLMTHTGHIPAEWLLGHIEPASDPRMRRIDPVWASREGMFMHHEAYEAFLQMAEAARKDGIHLRIVSAARSFAHQKRIWEDKWHGRRVLYGGVYATDICDPNDRAREILRFSAMPGTSRHHWGTDIDLNSLDNAWFASGQGLRLYTWMQENAARFGFCQPYTPRGQNRGGGYEEEKWHWSYKPIASLYLQAWENELSEHDIRGFDGWETAVNLKVVGDYVLGVDPSCL